MSGMLQQRQLGDCLTLISGGTPSKARSDFWGGEIPWVSCKDMKVDRIHDAEDHLTSLGAENGTRLVPKNTILIVVRGMILAREFPVAMSKRTVAFNQDLKAVRPAEFMDTDFLFHWFRANAYEIVGRADEAGHGTKRIQTDRLLSMPIDVPTLSEQRRIAGILSAYDDLIENNQRRIRLLEEMVRALYREWFLEFRIPGHGKHPRVASPFGDIPKGWDVVSFTEIADVLSGGTPKTDVVEYWGGAIPFFTPRDAPEFFYVQDTDKQVTDLGLSKCASELYPPDTVFITARGTVGKVALPSVPMAMNQSCYALRGKPGIPQRFLFLMTLQQVDYLKTNTGGATFGTIVVDTFRRMDVVKPPQEIVARFSGRTDAMFEQMDTLQRAVHNLRKTRDLLLPYLLSGRK